MFADDCVIYLSGNNWQIIHRRLHRDFDAILDWTYRNNLRLNPRHRISNLDNPVPFNAGVNVIQFVKSHVYLGITLDSTMSLAPLRRNIKKRVSNMIFRLRKVRKYMNFDAAVAVYKQTILPIFDYSGFMLLSSNITDLDDLQILQNDVLRICTRVKLCDKVSITELHKKCKIISLKQRMQRQILWLMYLLSKEKSYLHVSGRNTRSTDKIQFKIPAKICPLYEHSPYYIGTTLWNGLSKGVQKIENVYMFKKEIGKSYNTYKKV